MSVSVETSCIPCVCAQVGARHPEMTAAEIAAASASAMLEQCEKQGARRVRNALCPQHLARYVVVAVAEAVST